MFADKRIGENDPTLDDENKYLYRLQRERSKRVRKRARFSLNDNIEDENEDGSFRGQGALTENEDFSVLKKDDYESEGLSDPEHDGDDFLVMKKSAADRDEEDDGEQEGQRTHQEIMNEVVQKSKMHKAQRQHEKSIADEATSQLDGELPSLIPLLAKSSIDFEREQRDRASSKGVKLVLSLSKSVSKGKEVRLFEDDDGNANGKAGGELKYEDVYRELAYEKRARPSERLLTEEEKAEREREKLVELERQRSFRMEHLDGDDEAGSEAKKIGKKRSRGGDDLEDDVNIEDLDSESVTSDEADEDGEDDVAEDRKSSVKEYSKEMFWKDFTEEGVVAAKANEAQEVPFLFKRCPSTGKELQELFEKTSLEQRGLIVERLQTCFALSLNPGRNRQKLERLLECILFRIERLAEVSGLVGIAVKEIDMLLVHVHKLGKQFGGTLYAWARCKLAEWYNSLTSKRSASLSQRWGVNDVIVMRGVGQLYPCSDMRHSVCTPLALLLSEGLSIERMHDVEDVALGVFVGNVLLEQLAARKGYTGELGAFVHAVLSWTCKGSKRGQSRREGLESIFGEISAVGGVDDKLCLLDCMGERIESRGGRVIVARKVAEAVIGLCEKMSVQGRVRHMDLVIDGLDVEAFGKNIDIRRRLREIIVRGRAGRVGLELYSGDGRKAVGRMVNPKFSAESGVYRKRPKTSYHAAQSGDVSGSAQRVRRALRKEERGLARDVRRGAEVAAAEQAETERVEWEKRDQKDKEIGAFWELQRSTWRAAEKRQNKLSGKKW